MKMPVHGSILHLGAGLCQFNLKLNEERAQTCKNEVSKIAYLLQAVTLAFPDEDPFFRCFCKRLTRFKG